MAEIRVEQERRRGLGWLWLLILLALVAAAVWYFTNSRVENVNTPADSVRTGAMRAVPAAVVATLDAASRAPVGRAA
jgi:hypothetical protein